MHRLLYHSFDMRAYDRSKSGPADNTTAVIASNAAAAAAAVIINIPLHDATPPHANEHEFDEEEEKEKSCT